MLERERVELELDVELERLIRDLSVERLILERERVELEAEPERFMLERERVELEFDIELLYFERESLLVPDENDRVEEGVERL